MKRTFLRLLLFFIFLLLAKLNTEAQDSSLRIDSNNYQLHHDTIYERTIFSDSITSLQKDSFIQNKDSVFTDSVLPVKPVTHFNWETDTVWQSFIRSQFKEPNNKPVFLLNEERTPSDKTGLFYLLLGNIFLLGVLKTAFPKYYKRVLSVFVNTSFLKSLSDAIYQNRLPSLLFNVLFAFSAAILLAFLSQQYNWLNLNFWQVLAYSFLFILLFYTGKYVFINFLGWLFHQQPVAELYLYLVFLLNKALGILLVPCLWLMAFGDSSLAYFGTMLAFILVAIIWLRRYILSFQNLKKNLSFQPLHFFIYLCGVEVLPLLVIIKAILDFLNQ